MFGRIDRLAEGPDADRELPHRPPRRGRRALRAGRGRLAGTGGRAVLPGHRPRADGPACAAATSPSRAAPARHRGRAVRRGPPRRRPRRGPRARRRRPAPGCAATPRCSPRSSAAAPASSATSSPPSRPSRTRSSARPRPACSSCRAVRAPARRSSRCTAPRTCCTRTASRSRTRACSSSGRTGSSCATSSGCCRRSARPASSRSCSPTSSPTSTSPGPASIPADAPSTARVKGDVRMAAVIDKAVSDRERPLREDLRVPFRTGFLRLTRRGVGPHRHGGAPALPPPQRGPPVRRGRGVGRAGRVVAGRADHGRRGAQASCRPCPRCAPRSSGCGRCSRRPQLLHDLFGSQALLRAGRRHRARRGRDRRRCTGPASDDVRDVRWTDADVALLDEAREVLGPVRRQAAAGSTRPTRSARTATSSSTRCRTSRRCSCGWWPAVRSTAR